MKSRNTAQALSRLNGCQGQSPGKYFDFRHPRSQDMAFVESEFHNYYLVIFSTSFYCEQNFLLSKFSVSRISCSAGGIFIPAKLSSHVIVIFLCNPLVTPTTAGLWSIYKRQILWGKCSFRKKLHSPCAGLLPTFLNDEVSG